MTVLFAVLDTVCKLFANITDNMFVLSSFIKMMEALAKIFLASVL